MVLGRFVPQGSVHACRGAAVRGCVLAAAILALRRFGSAALAGVALVGFAFGGRDVDQGHKAGPSFPAQLYMPGPNLWPEVIDFGVGHFASSGCGCEV